MTFDLSAVGFTTKSYSLIYDWKNLAAYTLGIGAKRDELEYLFEGAKGGMKVYPTFAVVPAFDAVVELLGKSGGNIAMVVHGGQTVRAHRAIPSGGEIKTTGTVKGIYDLKKFGQVILETNSSINGEPVFDTVWSIIFRGAGGFNGPRPPEAPEEPSVPKDRAPDWTFEEATSPEQALLYRISGDINPLHADPEFAAMVGFPQGPILHGLCTYGFTGRALLHTLCGSDPARFKSMEGRFSKPVFPGEALTIAMWVDGQTALFQTRNERGEVVLDQGKLTFT